MLINNINNENKHKHHEKSEFGLSLSFVSKTLRRFSHQPVCIVLSRCYTSMVPNIWACPKDYLEFPGGTVLQKISAGVYNPGH